jgi:hypothetical protein
MEAIKAAQALVSARVNCEWISDAAGFPLSEKEGLAAQEAMIAESGALGSVIGWKVTTEAALCGPSVLLREMH